MQVIVSLVMFDTLQPAVVQFPLCPGKMEIASTSSLDNKTHSCSNFLKLNDKANKCTNQSSTNLLHACIW